MQAAIGLMTDHLVEVEAMKSILVLLAEAQPIFHGRVIIEQGSIGRLDRGRNDVIRRFGGLGTADWLLFVDSDMVFTPDDFRKLAEWANPVRYPILSGLYYKDSTPPLPVAFRWDEDGHSKHVELSGDALQQVDGAGMGFMLIHIDALNKIYDNFAGQEEPWCDNGQRGPAGQPLADDLSFCYRATECGLPIHLVTTTDLGHIKAKALHADGWR